MKDNKLQTRKKYTFALGVILAFVFITALTGVASCSSCSATIEYNSTENIIYVYGNGFANLSCIDSEINDSTVLNEISPKVWLLNASIYVNGSNAILFINSSDCTELRMNETNVSDDRVVNITTDGELYVDSTTIQSWNASNNSPVIFNKYSTGERPYIFISGYAEINSSTMKHFLHVFVNRSNNIKIENNKFYEMGYYYTGGLRAASSDNMTIRNNEFNYTNMLLGDGWDESWDETCPGCAIYPGDDGSDYNLIENNTFIGWTERGGHLLRLEDLNDHNIIRNNTFTTNPEVFIELYVGSSYNVVESNTFIGGAGEGDYLMQISSSASHNVIRNNILNFTGGIGGGIGVDQWSFSMINNTIINNTIINLGADNATGIRIRANNPLKHHIVVVKNNIIKNFGYGIKIGVDRAEWIYDSVISNNIIYNSKLQGILINMTDNLTIKNNVIYNSSDDAIKIINPNASDITIKNNILASNGGYGINTVQSNIVNNYNDIWNNTLGNYNGTSAGTGDISEDPLFADPDNGDFHLKSKYGRWNGSGWVNDNETSPCIDAGAPSDDYSNEPKPNGGRINMGAYGNTPEASKSPSKRKLPVAKPVCATGIALLIIVTYWRYRRRRRRMRSGGFVVLVPGITVELMHF